MLIRTGIENQSFTSDLNVERRLNTRIVGLDCTNPLIDECGILGQLFTRLSPIYFQSLVVPGEDIDIGQTANNSLNVLRLHNQFIRIERANGKDGKDLLGNLSNSNTLLNAGAAPFTVDDDTRIQTILESHRPYIFPVIDPASETRDRK